MLDCFYSSLLDRVNSLVTSVSSIIYAYINIYTHRRTHENLNMPSFFKQLWLLFFEWTYSYCITAGYDSDVVLKAQKIYRDNNVYLHFERMKLNIRIGSANVYLSNLFGGDPVLGKIIYTFTYICICIYKSKIRYK